ncbi:MAG: type I DNA topoisomerase [Actinobacteria bacterium]|nr:type I DNA topoisomerase [Actinomycetota bacterium]
MPNHLIIVESPSKARTLAKFLGAGYTVKASMGHVRDLPKSKIGVDIDAGFVPEYQVIKGKEKQIRELVAASKKASTTLLAADPDREGEAIAWHIAQALKLRDPDRVVFHEITKGAVEAALAEPRKIDRRLVSAQEARRVIDRLVGYRLSPLLWRKIRSGLSAGRVQSVAVRLVVDRENEIAAFVPVESWTVEALLDKDGTIIRARLVGRRDAEVGGDVDKLELGTAEEADAVAAALAINAEGRPTANTPLFTVAAQESRETSRQPLAPHTTSTLQQDASSRLGLSPRRTMSVAQQLYEGVDIGDGPAGLITYMRTDSTRISPVAEAQAKDHITSAYGKEYVRTGAPRTRGKAAPAANIQDAHEAIRPTDVTRTPESLRGHLEGAQMRLYELIWRRFVASQMAAARFRNTRVTLHAGDYVFRASGTQLLFDGYQKVWSWKRDDDDKDTSLPALTDGEQLKVTDFLREQHFTQPPPRYSEASLIKELEERGIGRPSTFAPTVEVIEERNCVRQEERRLYPTELGKTVDGVLREHFPDSVDVDFTAALEQRLDGIEEGTREYEPTVREWYEPFDATVTKAETSMERVKVPVKDTGEECPQCHEGTLVIREGKFGEFTGCSRYPDCDFIKDRKSSTAEPTGEMCPDCGKPLVVRQGRRGPFVGCSGYPKCRHIKGDVAADGSEAPKEELGACPECGKPLGRKNSRRGSFVGCTGYPSCKYIQPNSNRGPTGNAAPSTAEPTGEMCPDCGKPLVTRKGRFGPFVSCSGYPDCKYRPPKGAKAKAGAAS